MDFVTICVEIEEDNNPFLSRRLVEVAKINIKEIKNAQKRLCLKKMYRGEEYMEVELYEELHYPGPYYISCYDYYNLF